MAAEDANARSCRETCEEVAHGLPSKPLVLEPRAAPPDALEREREPALREKVQALAAALSEVKLDSAVADEAAAHMDEFTLARFVIARDGKLDDAKRMFIETMHFRADRGVGCLRAELHASASHAPGSPTAVRQAAVRRHFFAGWGGCCRDGTPFFVEQLGRFDVSACSRDPEVFDLMIEAYICYLEGCLYTCRLASARTGEMQRATSIVDATGVSLSHASNVRIIKAVSKIGTSYYPELMRRVYIINAPWAFSAVWKLVAPFLPEQTRKKISISSGGLPPKLLAEIDASQLPAVLGGSNEVSGQIPRAEKIPASLAAELRVASSESSFSA